MKNTLKKIPGVSTIYKRLNSQFRRDDFVHAQLRAIPAGALILDAGCGSQRYREACEHLRYKAQDFGQYTTDNKQAMHSVGVGGSEGYAYGELDYVGDIWQISEDSDTFDAILCTEVFEHIPFPIETLREFHRLLKPGGTLILTAPANCLRHMDPYFFYSGFSDRWYEKFLSDSGFSSSSIEAVGDYYSWLALEIARTASMRSMIAKVALAPAFLYYLLKKPTPASINTMCMGYHVVAAKSVPPRAAANDA